jgi:hypothetical protein
MSIVFDLKVECSARAASRYTTDTIKKRLKQLRHRKDEAAKAEIVYLNKLLNRN